MIATLPLDLGPTDILDRSPSDIIARGHRILDTLPDAPCPTLSDRYMFIDTRQVVEDMKDLGFQVADVRRPAFRTKAAAFGVHEVDFRRPEDIGRKDGEAPRLIFINSYDGSRRAQLITGVFRFVCSNGLVVGDVFQQQKFLHLGDYASQLLEQIKESAAQSHRVFERIEVYRQTFLDRQLYLEMAEKALALRYPEGELVLDPELVISPRRSSDRDRDLYTTWNVMQENILKGGLPGRQRNGRTRTSSALSNIERSNKLNRELWNLLEDYAALA